MIGFALLIFLSISSGITDKDVKDYNTIELLRLFTKLLEYRPDDVNRRDVRFYLYTREIRNQEMPLDDTNDMDVTKESKFIIHGWIDNHNRPWYHYLTDEYVKKGDFNLIQVDWGRVSRSSYLSSAHNTILVGGQVARFILNHKLDPKKVHLIGHSLGAHTSGFAAQTIKNELGTRIRRITGLDPAGPGFWSVFVNKEHRLSSDDADIVDVIHTDGGMLGTYQRIGTFDIYLNGGFRIQPDCVINLANISTAGELFDDGYCSHTRAYVHFTEIINKVKFKCKKCKSWVKFMIGACSKNGDYVFGAEDINESMTGVCFVSTTKIE